MEKGNIRSFLFKHYKILSIFLGILFSLMIGIILHVTVNYLLYKLPNDPNKLKNFIDDCIVYLKKANLPDLDPLIWIIIISIIVFIFDKYWGKKVEKILARIILKDHFKFFKKGKKDLFSKSKDSIFKYSKKIKLNQYLAEFDDFHDFSLNPDIDLESIISVINSIEALGRTKISKIIATTIQPPDIWLNYQMLLYFISHLRINQNRIFRYYLDKNKINNKDFIISSREHPKLNKVLWMHKAPYRLFRIQLDDFQKKNINLINSLIEDLNKRFNKNKISNKDYNDYMNILGVYWDKNTKYKIYLFSNDVLKYKFIEIDDMSIKTKYNKIIKILSTTYRRPLDLKSIRLIP